MLNPAASVSGVKEQVIEGKTPEITLDQTRKLVASINAVPHGKEQAGGSGRGDPAGVGLRDRAILVHDAVYRQGHRIKMGVFHKIGKSRHSD